MTRLAFLYDDTVTVVEDVRQVTGIDHFGALRFRRRRLAERVDAAAAHAGWGQRLHLTAPEQVQALLTRIERNGGADRFLYMTADLAITEGETLELFLAKLAYADGDLLARPEGGPTDSGIASLGSELTRTFLAALLSRGRATAFAEIAELTRKIPLPPSVVSLSDFGDFMRFITGAFDTRAFNAIRLDGETITKASADKTKMKREHDYWYLLPPALQRFFVQPFDFTDHGETASYRMERLNVPDVALQWIHGSIDPRALGYLLDGLLAFLAAAPRREVGAAAARAAAEAAYVGKLNARMATLMAHPTGVRLSSIIADGTDFAGLPAVITAFKDRFTASLARVAPSQLVLQHGDPCFSNILFDRRSRLIKLIDPRGASNHDELYGDAYYDLAKLSHSILGGYDFVNNEAFEVAYGEGLNLELTLDAPPVEPCRQMFLDRVAAAGYDAGHMRLCEASLFLSMLPLHIEAPRKLLAYSLIAIAILSGSASPPGHRLGALIKAALP